MTASIIYEGDLRCKAIHLQSTSPIETDAPTDNQGKGERFSPTDLVCTALATCMITTMAIKTRDLGIDLKGTTIDVKKYMHNDPRRIIKIDVEVKYPPALQLRDSDRSLLQRIAENCPVMKSINPEIEVNSKFS